MWLLLTNINRLYVAILLPGVYFTVVNILQSQTTAGLFDGACFENSYFLGSGGGEHDALSYGGFSCNQVGSSVNLAFCFPDAVVLARRSYPYHHSPFRLCTVCDRLQTTRSTQTFMFPHAAPTGPSSVVSMDFATPLRRLRRSGHVWLFESHQLYFIHTRKAETLPFFNQNTKNYRSA